ncbi:hypothetical protein ACFY1L_55685 [Streptomyces sp. NPDC001663]|uniref:hypothetical protein n=1 Tax=Streptomyces sp. NPDC001663 TaxID=3364597 RepID=UPI0036AB2494
MSIRASRTTSLLALMALSAVGVGAVSGCGSEKEAGHQAEPAVQRARQVAAAWDGSQAAAAWRAGYHPVENAVQLPRGGLQSKADQRAYQTQNFVLRSDLPATRPQDGRVSWASGTSLSRPVMAATTAYESLAQARIDGPHLTVTGAKLGTMTLATTRGPATVPAWLFTLQGYTSPLKRAAVSPSNTPRSPIKPAHDLPDSQLTPLGRLVRLAEDGRSLTVIAYHGACDSGPAVHVLETGRSVVLSASVKNPDESNCTAQKREKQVTVELDRPMGDRVLLDAYTGGPVVYRETPGRR